MSSRKAIPKKIRQEVYEKYDGHCAYCGCKLDCKEMQVDHIESVYANADFHKNMTLDEANNIDNLLPSCRMCNFYKSTFSIEDFRKRIETLRNRLNELFIFKLAKKYGLVNETDKKVVFYFEKEKK